MITLQKNKQHQTLLALDKQQNNNNNVTTGEGILDPTLWYTESKDSKPRENEDDNNCHKGSMEGKDISTQRLPGQSLDQDGDIIGVTCRQLGGGACTDGNVP